MKDEELLACAGRELKKALGTARVLPSQAYALDSIASSLLVIARRCAVCEPTLATETLSADDVELIVRRLIDGKPADRKRSKA